MGDRGNIIIMPPGSSPVVSELITDPKSIFLYSHWGGKDVPIYLRDAIKSIGLEKARDPEALVDALHQQYLIRLFQLGEGNWPALMVDPSNSLVHLDADDKDWTTWTFEEFTKMSDKDLRLLSEAVFQYRYAARLERRLEEEGLGPYATEESPSYAVASIPLVLAGALGVAAYLKSRNQSQENR